MNEKTSINPTYIPDKIDLELVDPKLEAYAIKKQEDLKGAKRAVERHKNKPKIDAEYLAGKDTFGCEDVSAEVVIKATPVRLSQPQAQTIADRINTARAGLGDTPLALYFQDICMGYLDFIQKPSESSVTRFLNAAKYLSYKAAGVASGRAFAKVFPEKAQILLDKGIDLERLYDDAISYENTQMVSRIKAAMAVPMHILFQDIKYKAIMVQAAIMEDEKIGPFVRSKAADSILTHLKSPETQKLEVSLDTPASNILDQFKESMANMAKQQKQLIDCGMATVVDTAKHIIYDESADIPERD